MLHPRRRWIFRRVRRLEICFLMLVLIIMMQFFWVSSSLGRIDPFHNTPAWTLSAQDLAEGSGDVVAKSTRHRRMHRPKGKKITQWVAHRKKKVNDNVSMEPPPSEPKTLEKKTTIRFNPEKEGRARDLPVPLKVQFPIFVASLPKSGTTSIFQYFVCGGHPASHQWVKINETDNEQSGKCIRRNIAHDRAPFEQCGSTEIFTDTGFAVYLTGGKLPHIPTDCYYPSIQALEAIYKHYPEATIINVIRDAGSWFRSMKVWGNGSLLKRWMICDIPGMPRWHATEQEFLDFYEWHSENIRQFAQAHPSLTFLEITLESPHAGPILENTIGIPSTCWGKCSPDSVFCERVE